MVRFEGVEVINTNNNEYALGNMLLEDVSDATDDAHTDLYGLIQGGAKMRRKKGIDGDLYKMHPILQGIVIVLAGFATVGWALFGIWFLYILMGN